MFEEKLIEYADKIEKILREKGPEAYDLFIYKLQVEAAQELLVGFLLLMGSGVFVWLSKYFNDEAEETDSYSDEEDYKFASGLSLVISVICMVVSLFLLLDFWNWIPFIYPDLAAANYVFEQVK